MKLVRFGPKNQEKPGVIINGKRKDCSAYFKDWNRDFFLNNGLDALQKLVSMEGGKLLDVPESSRWGACIARPGMIMCIGLNYSDHAKESGLPVPEEPVLFMKAANTLSGPYDDVVIPKGSQKTDWEVELGIVLNTDVSYLENEAHAHKCIVGYCVVHDVSEREF